MTFIPLITQYYRREKKCYPNEIKNTESIAEVSAEELLCLIVAQKDVIVSI